MASLVKFSLTILVSLSGYLHGTSLELNLQPRSDAKFLLCYYDPSSYWREGIGNFQVQDFDAELCSTVLYSFFGVKEATGRLYSKDPGLDFGPGEIEPDPDDDINYQGDLDMIRKTVRLREEGNPELKVLLSVGGPNYNSAFSSISRDPTKRREFALSALEYMQRFNLDGMDLHWISPLVEDKGHFVQLVEEVKNALSSSEKTFVLTLPIDGKRHDIEEAYDLPQLSQFLDFYNILTLDFKSYSEESEASQKIGHHSPLRPKDEETELDRNLTVASVVEHLLLHVSSEKLILGVAAYGRTYSLQSPQQNNFYDDARGPGPQGEFTGMEGFLAYFEICNIIKGDPSKWTFKYDYEYSVPYVMNDSVWIGYDNEISIREKVDYAIDKGLGGVLVRNIDLDDHKNICGAWSSFPITHSVKDRIDFWKTRTGKLSSNQSVLNGKQR